MQYTNIRPAVFLSRPNRFIARVEIDGQEETVHVKNTGRCKELLVPGRTVWLEEGSNPNRKTKYDLIAVDKDGLLVNMDAQAPNKVFAEWAHAGHFVPNLTLLRPETTWGKSRFDFYWKAGDRRGFVEVKGCTLEDDGFTMVPFGQGFRDMSNPTKDLMRFVLERSLRHNRHPVLRWNIDNVFVRTDPAGNLKIDKEKSTEKVDGAVALVMALDRALKNQNAGSVYDDRGFLIL